jgi:ribosome maturation factor RimP
VATAAAQLETLIQPAVAACECEFWGLEYLSQGRFSTLRVYIDHAQGVDVDMCANVSRQVSAILDVEDPIAGEYNLEVSSPGLDRPLFTLAQYELNIGQTISLRLRLAFEGRRKFTGLLRGVEGDDVVLLVDDEEFLLPVGSIEKANVVPQF